MVNGYIHNTLVTPVAIRFTKDDLEYIKSMREGFDVYVAGPRDDIEKMREMAEILKPKSKKECHG